jgi:hypothetical protein
MTQDGDEEKGLLSADGAIPASFLRDGAVLRHRPANKICRHKAMNSQEAVATLHKPVLRASDAKSTHRPA